MKPYRKEILQAALIAIAFYLFFHFVLMPGEIPSESMEPTLMKGDYAICNSLAYVWDAPKRGDIIVFQKDGEYIIKRIAGIPGDYIGFQNGNVYLNGFRYIESYLPEDSVSFIYFAATPIEYGPVPENSYFVMGDNRIDSFDSRYWEDPYISGKDIVGKMILRIPLSKLKTHP